MAPTKKTAMKGGAAPATEAIQVTSASSATDRARSRSVSRNQQQQEEQVQKVKKRVKLTARMSTGGKAPRKPLMTKIQRQELAKAAAVAKQTGRGRPRGNRRKPRRNFKLYIYKSLKNVYADLGISKHAISVVDSFTVDMFQRVASEASELCKINNKKPTLSAREIQTAISLILPGEIRAHAINEGLKALTKLKAARDC